MSAITSASAAAPSLLRLAKAPVVSKASTFTPVLQTGTLSFSSPNANGISKANFSDLNISDNTTTMAITVALKANQKYTFSIPYSGSQPVVTLKDSKGKSTTIKPGLGFTCAATGTYTLTFAAPFSLNLAGQLKTMVMTGAPVLPTKTGNISIDALLMGGTSDWWHSAYGATVGSSPVAPGAIGLDSTSSATNLTYSFLSAKPSDQTMTGFAAMDATQRQAVRDALAVYSKLINVTFTELTDGSQGNINFGMNDQGSNSAGYAYLPGTLPDPTKTYLYLSNNQNYGWTNNDAGMAVGNYGWQTALHEIGHTLGLKHPGNYNGNSGAGTPPYLPKNTDNRSYSIMSYKGVANTYGVCNTSPMMYDIAALQYLYGANQSGSTAVDGKFSFGDSSYVQTLWSTNGTDTIDLSTTTKASDVNLNAGTFSNIDIVAASNSTGYSGYNDVSIAYGAKINKVTLSSTSGVADTVTLNNAFASGSYDSIASFDASADKIVLNKSLFGSIAAKNIEFNTTGVASKSTSKIIVNTTTGSIYYDTDGNGKGVAKKIAQYSLLQGSGALTGSNLSIVA